MGKTKRINCEDEEKENRLYKRFKRAERKFKKQEKRYLRLQERRDQESEVMSPESQAKGSLRDVGPTVVVQKRRSNTGSETGAESDDSLAIHNPPTDPRMDNVKITVTDRSTDKSLDTVVLDTPLLQNVATTVVSAALGSVEPSTGTPGETEDVTVKDSGSASFTIAAVQKDSVAEVPTAVSASATVPEESAGSEEILDPRILELMGKRLILDRIPAPDIHRDLVVRWQEILLKGLPADERKQMLEKYPPPANCAAIDPPKLNAEVRASLSEAIIKKDFRVVARQERVAACLAALGKSLSLILKSNHTENLVLFGNLSDTARLLADIQHDDSLIRRSLILSNLNTSLKDTLNSTVVDEWLFGKNLEEQLKSAKLLERSTKDLRPEQKAQSSSKNFKGPPRHAPFKRQPKTQGGQFHSATQSQSNFRKPLRGKGRGYPHQDLQKKWT